MGHKLGRIDVEKEKFRQNHFHSHGAPHKRRRLETASGERPERIVSHRKNTSDEDIDRTVDNLHGRKYQWEGSSRIASPDGHNPKYDTEYFKHTPIEYQLPQFPGKMFLKPDKELAECHRLDEFLIALQLDAALEELAKDKPKNPNDFFEILACMYHNPSLFLYGKYEGTPIELLQENAPNFGFIPILALGLLSSAYGFKKKLPTGAPELVSKYHQFAEIFTQLTRKAGHYKNFGHFSPRWVEGEKIDDVMTLLLSRFVDRPELCAGNIGLLSQAVFSEMSQSKLPDALKHAGVETPVAWHGWALRKGLDEFYVSSSLELPKPQNEGIEYKHIPEGNNTESLENLMKYCRGELIDYASKVNMRPGSLMQTMDALFSKIEIKKTSERFGDRNALPTINKEYLYALVALSFAEDFRGGNSIWEGHIPSFLNRVRLFVDDKDQRDIMQALQTPNPLHKIIGDDRISLEQHPWAYIVEYYAKPYRFVDTSVKPFRPLK